MAIHPIRPVTVPAIIAIHRLILRHPILIAIIRKGVNPPHRGAISAP